MTNSFRIELRALASLRIAAGLLIIADLLIRWGDIGWFMSDYGAYSVAASKQAASDFRFSLYWLFDGLWWVHTLFMANVLVAILLILGVRVRWMSLLAFALIVSLHNRNPILLQGGLLGYSLPQILRERVLRLPARSLRCNRGHHRQPQGSQTLVPAMLFRGLF